MEIKFSRHAKRRAKLYEIPEKTIIDILNKTKFKSGEHEIIRPVPEMKYPLKIVVSVKGNLITIITNYPLKKGRPK